jgi:hypothetical protein
MSGDSDELRPRPRTPKGLRPYAMNEPHAERVLYVAMAVATELSVLHDKVDTITRLAEAKGLLTPQEIEDYTPPPEVAAEREAWRKAYIRRLLRIMEEMIPAEEEKARAEYTAFVEEIAAAPEKAPA